MVSEKGRVSPELEMLYHRILRLGVSYGDFKKLKANPLDFESWAAELSHFAKGYENAADDAWQQGKIVSAMEWWRKAADYFHNAQLFLPYSPAKIRLRKQSQGNFFKMMQLYTPKADRINISFQNMKLPGYLRVSKPGAPIVILINGLDSSKEVELFYFAEVFLKRGISTLCIDFPGQGELFGVTKMNADIEVVNSAIVDFIIKQCIADSEKIGIFGVSFGGHLAIRSAALDKRIKACICLGSFFDASALLSFYPAVHAAFCTQFGIQDQTELQNLYGNLSLAPFAGKMTRPLLVIHGDKDDIFDVSQAKKIHAWASGPKELWIFEGAEHVCSSCFDLLLPQMGDWMVEQLV